MIRSWRVWVLLLLLVGPLLAYMGLGGLWLYQKGWGFYAFTIWVTLGIFFGILSVRWTKDRQAVLPPIDWDSPRTFVKHDQQGWTLVEQEADQGDSLTMENLSNFDTYIETGKRLATRLAAHYHPLSTNPIENLPIVQILTALDLAADDLIDICREIPGGDMVTMSHWKKAVQAAGLFSKANEIYGYLLPIFQPTTGLVRLGTQKWMVQPAWKSMQQNVLRWFYRAYVNRLGIHLIELYSGRLAIGADQYRRLTRKARKKGVNPEIEGPSGLEIAVVGAVDAGKTALISLLDQARAGDLETVRAKLEADGFDETLVEFLKQAEWVEVPGYTVHPGGDHARDRTTRRETLQHAVESDLALLLIDARRDDLGPEVKFVEEWDAYFAKNPMLDPPPLLALVNGADRLGGDREISVKETEAAIKAKADAVRAALPASVLGVVAVGLNSEPPWGITDRLLPAIAPLLDRAEKAAVIRHLHHASTRSRARRLIGQVGRTGRKLWENLRTPKKQKAGAT